MLPILNRGCHAQDNMTVNNTQGDYQSENLYAAAGDVQTSVTTKDVIIAAKTVESYTEKNDAVPSIVQVGSQKVTKEQFTYLMAQAILNINKYYKTTTTITPIKVLAAPNPTGTATGTLTKSNYIKSTSSLANFMKTNGRSPNYVTTNIGRVNPESIVHAMSEILAFYNNKGRLPSYSGKHPNKKFRIINEFRRFNNKPRKHIKFRTQSVSCGYCELSGESS